MTGSLCKLCAQNEAIKNSHIIPAFVYRAIKSDSPTKFFRNIHSPNKRLQDGDKEPLLCQNCEQRFSAAEKLFASNIFLPFHNNDVDNFEYQEWLHYFLISLAWRTLACDLEGFTQDNAVPPEVVSTLSDAESIARKYLLGTPSLGARLKTHVTLFTIATDVSPDLVELNPNVMFRRSAFGYTIWDKSYGYSAVIHNLAGFMCFFIIKGNPRDQWTGTKVFPGQGEIKQPQKVHSWLIADVIHLFRKNKTNYMSEKQETKVLSAIKSNTGVPNSKRIWEADMDLRSGN